MTHILMFITNIVAIDVNVNPDNFSRNVQTTLALPILNGAEILIPAAIAISGIHKLMEHRETAGSLLIELVTKGGGTLLIIQLIKAFVLGQ